jgi:hypothetical protein
MAGGDPLFPKTAGSYIFTSVTGSRGGAMEKANIDELYAIDEGDPGA